MHVMSEETLAAARSNILCSGVKSRVSNGIRPGMFPVSNTSTACTPGDEYLTKLPLVLPLIGSHLKTDPQCLVSSCRGVQAGMEADFIPQLQLWALLNLQDLQLDFWRVEPWDLHVIQLPGVRHE